MCWLWFSKDLRFGCLNEYWQIFSVGTFVFQQLEMVFLVEVGLVVRTCGVSWCFQRKNETTWPSWPPWLKVDSAEEIIITLFQRILRVGGRKMEVANWLVPLSTVLFPPSSGKDKSSWQRYIWMVFKMEVVKDISNFKLILCITKPYPVASSSKRTQDVFLCSYQIYEKGQHEKKNIDVIYRPASISHEQPWSYSLWYQTKAKHNLQGVHKLVSIRPHPTHPPTNKATLHTTHSTCSSSKTTPKTTLLLQTRDVKISPEKRKGEKGT